MVLAWLDLEMTGLDVREHVILQIASLITDDSLEVVAHGPDIVIHQPQRKLRRMNEFVRSMHTESGLLRRVKSSSTTLQEANQMTLAFLKRHVSEPGTVPLCGNSIGMDRRFLARFMPDIENYLHYRSIDVTTVKELARRWDNDVYARAPKKTKSHLAHADILESLNELRHYRDCGFIGPVLKPPLLTNGQPMSA